MSFSEDTDVLTARGWVPWASVIQGDALATLSPAGELVYQTPTHLVSYTHRGQMLAFAGSGVDVLVTPHHRLYVSPMAGAKVRRERRFSFLPAIEAHERAHRYRTHAVWRGGADCGWSEDELFFLGMLFGRGEFYSGYVAEMRVAAYKRLSRFWELADRLGFPRKKRRFVLVEANPRIREVFDGVRSSGGIPATLLRSWSADNLATVLEGALFSGAVKLPHSSKLLVKHGSEKMIDALHHLLVMTGRSGYRDGIDYDESRLMIEYIKHRLVVYSENRYPELNRKRRDRPRQSALVDTWQGRVFSAEVPHGTVFVRHGGHAVWCGSV